VAGTIIGFNLGDELVNNCISPAALETGANAIRADFPRGEAIIWYNEASGPVKHPLQAPSQCHHIISPNATFEYKIPTALDWFSIDMYHMNGVVEGWVKDQVRDFYDRHIFPNLTLHQRAVLVPGAFGSNVNKYPNGTEICNRTCYDAMCAHDAVDFMAWAQGDPRVVGIFPWNWGGCASCNGSRFTPPHTCCMDEIGARDQPATRAAWAAIGTRIKHH